MGPLVVAAATLRLAAADEAAEEPLPAALLEAETVCLMDAGVMDHDLKDRFRAELEEWGRFEIVLFPDEADVLMSLSARADYTTQPVEEECDPDDPLCDRAEGTTQIFEKLYLKVFVQGGDDLWSDEEPVGEGDAAATSLVARLRARIEPTGSEESDGSDEG
jgi:hypothetical protein